MKSYGEIIKRFFNVVYALFLTFGLLFTYFFYFISSPHSYDTYSYKVVCNNGKTFDPTSKPIMHNNEEPHKFLINQINSECETGKAGEPIFFKDDLPINFSMDKIKYTHVVTTREDQIKNTLMALVIYYFSLEIIRRTILYIFTGRKFLNVRSSSK